MRGDRKWLERDAVVVVSGYGLGALSSTALQDLVTLLNRWLPIEAARICVAAGVVLVGYVVASLLRSLAARLFRQISARLVTVSRGAGGADSPAPPEATEQAEAAAIDLAARVVFWLVFALFLGTGTSLLGFPVLSAWLESLAAYLPRVLAAVAILLLGVIFGLFLRIVVVAALASSGPATARSLGRAAQIAVVGLAAGVAFEGLGLEMTLLVVVAAVALGAVLGGAALAFGLGAGNTVRNLLACHYLAKWYRVGQVVRVGEHQGRIVAFAPGAVVLQTDTGKLYVPAHEMVTQPSLTVAEGSGD